MRHGGNYKYLKHFGKKTSRRETTFEASTRWEDCIKINNRQPDCVDVNRTELNWFKIQHNSATGDRPLGSTSIGHCFTNNCRTKLTRR
jgi:hypothetical protein